MQDRKVVVRVSHVAAGLRPRPQTDPGTSGATATTLGPRLALLPLPGARAFPGAGCADPTSFLCFLPSSRRVVTAHPDHTRRDGHQACTLTPVGACAPRRMSLRRTGRKRTLPKAFARGDAMCPSVSLHYSMPPVETLSCVSEPLCGTAQCSEGPKLPGCLCASRPMNLDWDKTSVPYEPLECARHGSEACGDMKGFRILRPPANQVTLVCMTEEGSGDLSSRTSRF